MEKIYLTGIAGTGKSSVGDILIHNGINAIDMEEVPELCCWADKVTGERVFHKGVIDKVFMDAHDWICDVDRLQNLLKAQKDTVVAVGVASNQREVSCLFDKVLLLQCKPETFVRRLVARSNNHFGKDKTAREFLVSYYKDFEGALHERGAIPINAEEPLDMVVRAVMQEVRGLPAGFTVKMDACSGAIPARLKRYLTRLPHFLFG
jgi:shikimate kinase